MSDEMQSDPPLSTEDKPHVHFPPPLVYIGFMLLGALADRMIPLAAFEIIMFQQYLGGGLLLLGILLLLGAIGLFRSAKENPEPWTPTKAIIETGLYRHTRNPMYLAMAVVYLGITLIAASLGMLILWPVTLACINLFVIRQEEAYLTRTFGDGYTDYQKRVRRWI